MIHQDTEKTTVVFRRFKNGGDLIALFPYEKHHANLCMSYQALGQHGGADYVGCIRGSVPIALDDNSLDYAELKKELESLGYNLNIVKKFKRKQS